ncbi:MAG: CRISPR-associated helicase Cas3', partial [Magnetococcales bacterium]|nr:CRISPR-associated helicase Cas3' [Magnetococcales bacterium]
LRHWAEALHCSEDVLRNWIGYFLAIHDTGKFSISFQNLRPELLKELQNRESKIDYGRRHDGLGWLMWQKHSEEQEEDEILASWARAAMGHHGRPPGDIDQTLIANELLIPVTPADWQALALFYHEVAQIFNPESLSCQRNAQWRKTVKRFSWWLAGFCVLSDWLGSSEQFFQFEEQPVPLHQYWISRRHCAEQTIQAAGIVSVPAAPEKSFSELLPHLAGRDPTPLQWLAGQISLDGGPHLFILEDVTGAGKTEAAFMLIHRLMASGQSDGFFLALPTMATASALYARVGDVFGQFFQNDRHKASLVLAHGARDLSDRFRRSWQPEPQNERDYAADESPAATHCQAWFADSNKKALLAQGGVGTIDQLLLSVLTVKYQALRLFGTFGKALVIDEVHANDEYMHNVLLSLLRFHAYAGGHVVLLSATLTKSMKQELVNAFCAGASYSQPTVTSDAYPLLTHMARQGIVEHPVAARAEISRPVDVVIVSDLATVIEQIVSVANTGNCVCWVRNTVTEAQQAYQLLSRHIPENRLEFFHARFALGDRLAIEERVLSRFGFLSGPDQRRGRVLVATQVVEQSLDLDFDFMVTDLAPIDLLIQRAGRLHRHQRRMDGTRCNEADQRGRPCLWVYGPQPEAEPKSTWFSSLSKGSAAVYPNHGAIWLTARLLQKQGGFTMPDDARSLIEGVYGPAAAMPPGLEAVSLRVDGEKKAKGSQAGFNTVKLDEGYATGFQWGSEQQTPTRLGEPQSTLRLLRWQDGQLRLWVDQGFHTWELSQVKVRQSFAYKEAPQQLLATDLWQALEQLRQQWPDRGKWIIALPLQSEIDGWWWGWITDVRDKQQKLFYHQRWGIVLGEEKWTQLTKGT